MERLRGFFFLLLVGAGSYAIDCAIALGAPQNFPWFERGIYAGPSFLVTIALVGGAFAHLIFGKDKR